MDQLMVDIVPSKIGEFYAGATDKGCVLFEFHDRRHARKLGDAFGERYGLEVVKGKSPHIDAMADQVHEYLEGRRKSFELTLDLRGTPFEKSVWNLLMKIPYGKTRSYGDIASEMGKPGASRAVGRANGANHLPIIVPCHRVIESTGNLRGYGGGLWRKKFLLDLEREGAAPSLPFRDQVKGTVPR